MTQATTEPVPDPAEAREMTRGKFMRALGIGGGALLGAGMLAKLSRGEAAPSITTFTDTNHESPQVRTGKIFIPPTTESDALGDPADTPSFSELRPMKDANGKYSIQLYDKDDAQWVGVELAHLNRARFEIDGRNYPATATGMQAAIDAAGEDGTVIFPPADYAIGTTTLKYYSGQTIIFSSRGLGSSGGSTVTYTGTGTAIQPANLDTNARTWYTRILGLKLIANTAAKCIDISGCVHSEFENITISSSNASGIGIYATCPDGTYTTAPYYNTISNCYISGTALGTGIKFSSGTNTGINSNNIRGGKISAVIGVHLDNGASSQNHNHVVISDVAFEVCTIGVHIERGLENTVQNCRLENCTTAGVQFGTNARRNLVIGGLFSGNGANVIDNNSSTNDPNAIFAPVGTSGLYQIKAWQLALQGTGAVIRLPNNRYYESYLSDGTTVTQLMYIDASNVKTLSGAWTTTGIASLLAGGQTNSLSELTPGNGVTIDGCNIKDGAAANALLVAGRTPGAASGVATLDASGKMVEPWASGVTGSRPGVPSVGHRYFDTTLGKPIWYTGAAWVDATGAAV